MTRLLLNILQATLSGVYCTYWRLSLTGSAGAGFRRLHDAVCICHTSAVSLHFTVPIRINKTIYTGPSAAIRTYLPAVFRPRTHIWLSAVIAVFAVLAGKTIWDYRNA